ncbi:ADP-ribosylation factor-binding protein GGA3a isoform X1 [Brienomyrus brachyistius]|uniref:ADP-ribosylation factor-binding protein GGA3a isoform X1 n=1 Tax=Brienomyrus brachyistius TaxID=42636 RepID=UPI0020B38E30|nr:ADP-ribosylation factor-binding protein GGA3a isoform X1 [Brienomyrus brachyistius]XP_048870164.1 ADP-ribosylation factor-binding protein GGA3a isoform X1 [Brienomyrus brachyistius]
MADPEGESLESWLNKATNPSNRQEDWEYIIGFCDQINKELEGPQIAVRLLAHKIQSPQEWEAIQALTVSNCELKNELNFLSDAPGLKCISLFQVLEACMKNCGRRFYNEVGKFRFLNELIKVVSPKYLGDRVSEKVKIKIIEMLYSWAVALPDETKINEAYQMLKRQGIVTTDPEIPVDKTLIPSPPVRPKNPIFENEEKSKLLAELLKSKNPEDLQEANRLIKNMVKEDEARMQKVTKRMNTLEEVNNNVKLLNEMLSHFNREESSDGDKELIKELYDRCDKLRRTVFKLATETEDNDNSLGDILQASDDLSRVINSYKKTVEGQSVNGETDVLVTALTQSTRGHNPTETLIDLAGLDIPTPSPPESVPDPTAANQPPAPSIPVLPPPPCKPTASQGCPVSQTESPRQPSSGQPSTALSLLDEELLSLGLNDPVPTLNSQTSVQNEEELNSVSKPSQAPSSGLDFFGGGPLPGLMFPNMQGSMGPSQRTPVCYPETPRTSSFPFPSTVQSSSASLNQGLQDLAMLDLGDPKSSIPGPLNSAPVFGPVSSAGLPHPPMPGLPMSSPKASALAQTVSSTPGSPLFRSLSPILPPSQGSPAKGPEVSLANVHVPLESIKPSIVLPVTAYDKDGVRVLLHFATECPPGRPDVLVLVVSMLNTAPLPVHSVVLQAAVPKSMKVKLQPPTGTELAPFNPILPPASITQVMLLANPLKEKVRLRYKLMFTLGDRQCTEVGEVDQFPPVEKWGNL